MFNEKADGWKDVNGCSAMKNDVLFEDGRPWTMSLVDTNDSGRIRLHPSSLSLTNDWNTPETSSQPNCRSSPKLSCDFGHEEYSCSKDHHSIPVACGRRGGGLETSSICQNYPTHTDKAARCMPQCLQARQRRTDPLEMHCLEYFWWETVIPSCETYCTVQRIVFLLLLNFK